VKVFHFEQELQLACNLEEAWRFFSNPANLEKITPPQLGFKTVKGADFPMKVGQEITHKVRVFPFIWLHWTSRIEEIHWCETEAYFSDIQVRGPYAAWKHRHEFTEVKNGSGVRMTDRVEYSLFPDLFAPLIDRLYIRKKLEGTFAMRNQLVKECFQDEK